MANNYISYNQYKHYYLPQRIGPGALGNDQVKMCKFCSQNGFHNEPIIFRRHNGRWHPVNYFNGQPHQHRQRTQQDDA
jgi:hypothetical protein